MLPFRYIAVFALVALVAAQDYDYESRPAPARIQPGYSGPAAPKPTPVAILKQINRHNEDGSYTYGYEGGDGSFKIETKTATGEVKGKYGYVDDTGKVRVVEYGATKYGFEPSGEGITVAPPTLVDETTNKDGTFNQEYAQQYEEPQQQQAPRQHIPRPRPTQSFEYAPAPQQAPQYAPPQQFQQRSPSPVPSRAQISGASPLSGAYDFVPQRPIPSRSFGPSPVRAAQPSFAYNSAPAPIEEQTYEQPAPRPQPRPQTQQFQFAPSPQATQAITRPQPQYAPRPAGLGAQATRPSGGVLDQLAKDYALPAGGAAALHDISFGYY